MGIKAISGLLLFALTFNLFTEEDYSADVQAIRRHGEDMHGTPSNSPDKRRPCQDTEEYHGK